MKDLHLLVWLTQLGLSVALPPAGFILLAVWIRRWFELGVWVIIVGVILGIVCAIDGLVFSLRTMRKFTDRDADNEPSVSFNDHD